MKKNRKFPADVARFLHPEKSPSPNSFGIHQREKAQERSNIPVYVGYGPARRTMDKEGRTVYRFSRERIQI